MEENKIFILEFIVLLFFIFIVLFLVKSVLYFLLAKRLNYKNKYYAFIPFLRVILLLNLVNLPWWYLFFLFIPFLNIYIYTLLWMKLAKRFSYHPVIALLNIMSSKMEVIIAIMFLLQSKDLSSNKISK